MFKKLFNIKFILLMLKYQSMFGDGEEQLKVSAQLEYVKLKGPYCVKHIFCAFTI